MNYEARCLTLDERLSPDYESKPGADEALAGKALTLWSKIATGGREDIFAKRLERDGLTPEAVRARLGAIGRRLGVPQPAWLDDALAVRSLLATIPPNTNSEVPTTPFGPLLVTLIQSSVAEIEALPAWKGLLSPAARAAAARQLCQALGDVLGLPLLQTLTNWRAEPENAHGEFEAFLDHMRRTGVEDLFGTYPVLARVIGVLRRQWIDAYGRFLKRLETDHAMLAKAFGGQERLEVADLRYGISDPHGDGDTVLELCLSSDRSLFYKPRSLTTDAMVRDIAACFNRLDATLELKVPDFVDCGDYGWVEGVAATSCRTRQEVADYYRRAGAWLGCFHLLNASDIHMENLLACGSQPVPVDFETIFQALSTKPAHLSAGGEAHWRAANTLEESVLAVGMLPGYVRAEHGAAISVGGLEASRFEVKRLVWSNVNTVTMTAEVRTQAMVIDGNLPVLNGERVPLDAFRNEVLTGLRTVLATAAQEKLAFRALIERARDQGLAVRRIVRPTRFYYLLMRRMLDHRTMIDGVTWSLQSELIARLYDWDEDATQPWKLFREERAALCRLTIPVFYLDADRTVARMRAEAGRGVVTNLHARPGLDVALERLARLDAAAIDKQCALAAVSLGVTRGVERGAQLISAPLDLVGAIIGHLQDKAIEGAGSVAWLGLEYLDHRMMSQVVPIGYDLYNGGLGVAVFLAAASRLRQDALAGDLARRAVAPVMDILGSPNRHRLVRTLGIGGFLGIGSLVYGLTTYDALIGGDAQALAHARMAVDLITPQALAADDRHDLVSGAAGAIMAVLRLHGATGDPVLLRRAAELGDALLDCDRRAGEPWTSPVFEDRAITGLSHGASGYALAFSRLYAVTGEDRYRAVVADCMAFEGAAFDEGQGNWRDTRPTGMRVGERAPNQWCYGAAGIGFARLALLDDEACPADSQTADLERAVASVLAIEAHSNDTLCCGIAGHADFLASAGRRLRRLDLKRAARARIDAIADRWARTGDVRWDQGDKDFNLGLMRGLSGIGYAALRVEHSEAPDLLVLG